MTASELERALDDTRYRTNGQQALLALIAKILIEIIKVLWRMENKK